MVEATLESISVPCPEPMQKEPQGMCLDKAYDSGEVRALVKKFADTAHIRSRGEEAQAIKRQVGFENGKPNTYAKNPLFPTIYFSTLKLAPIF